MTDPLLYGLDPWVKPDPDGCSRCHNDGEDPTSTSDQFVPCLKCYPDGIVP